MFCETSNSSCTERHSPFVTCPRKSSRSSELGTPIGGGMETPGLQGLLWSVPCPAPCSTQLWGGNPHYPWGELFLMNPALAAFPLLPHSARLQLGLWDHSPNKLLLLLGEAKLRCFRRLCFSMCETREKPRACWENQMN